MKKPIVIVLILLIILAGAGGLYAFGNLDGIIDKIFNRSKTTEEENFDEILIKIKKNLDEVGSVQVEKKIENYSKIMKGEMRKTNYGSDEYKFVFPNKKYFLTSPPYGNEEMDYHNETIIIDDNIYFKFGLFDLMNKYYKKTEEESSSWFYGKDGQSIPSFVPDSPGDKIDFRLADYPDGWDFTKNIEKIEEDLGIEEVNGVKCHHYKVKVKKIPYTYENMEEFDKYFLRHIVGINFEEFEPSPIEKEEMVQQTEDKIKVLLKDNEEILIPIPSFELLTLPFMYIKIAAGDYYIIDTNAIDGEIWVGENDFLVYKENYTTENTHFYFHPEKSIEENKDYGMLYYKYVYELTYSNFNADIKIEAPTENVITVEDYLKSIGHPVTKEEISKVQMKERDSKRKSDLWEISLALNLYYSDYNQYPVSINLERVNDENSNFYKALVPNYLSGLQIEEFLFDPKHPEFWYGYKSDGKTFELTARLENLEDEDCIIEDGICIYNPVKIIKKMEAEAEYGGWR